MVRRAVFWSYAGQFSTFFVNFFGTVIIARLLSPTEMGIYGVAMATTGVLQLFAAFNVGAFIVREVELNDRVVDTAFTVNAAISIMLSLVLFLLGFAGAKLVAEPAVATVIQLLALLPIIGIFTFRSSVLLQREMAFKGTSIIAPIGAAISIGATVVSALGGYSYLSPAFGALAGALFSAVATLWIGRRFFAVRVCTERWREMAAFGLRLMSIGGVSTAAVRVSEIVIAHFLGLAALGLYNRASNINNLIFQNLYGTATRVVFVRLSTAQRQQEAIGPVFMHGFRMITAIMGPVLIGLSILAGPFTLLLYGEKWLAAAPILSLILVAQFLSMAFAMNWELFVVRERMATQTWLEFARSVLGMVTTTIGSAISLIAVALSSIVDTIISIFIYGRLMPVLVGVSHKAIWRLYAEAVMLTAGASLPAALLMGLYRWSPHVPVAYSIVSVVLGGMIWFLLLVRLEHPLLDEIKGIILRLRPEPAA